MSLLQISNLSLRVGKDAILRDLSFEVDASEVVAITGESGSGKSMTALALMGLEPTDSAVSGTVTLDGTSLLELTDAQMCQRRGAEIGIVFQEPMTALNPVHNIGAQVSEVVRIHQPHLSRRAAKDIASQTLARVGLPQDRFPLSRFPHELSGGQRQRVMIAMAIALRPKLLIADEPTTALDVTTQAQILALLSQLAREDGMGLMMITHDLAVVAQMADHIMVMQKGVIVEHGETQSVLERRAHPYTQQLFAASAHCVALPPRWGSGTLLNVENVSRRYAKPRAHLFARSGTFEAVKNVSFHIERGERLGLVGESGCGKSTLTRAILGLDPIQTGRITLDGVSVFEKGRPSKDLRRKMQAVFQDPYSSFNPRHTVARLITEPFFLLPDPPAGAEKHAKVAEMLTAVGLRPSDANRYPHQFSGGQRQRIAIARALIVQPELIILDEAVSALDVSVRAQILDLLADLCRTYNLTYLFISHDLEVVRSVTDRVLVMKSGEIVEEGHTEKVFANPKHPYTQSLIAAAPVLPKM